MTNTAGRNPPVMPPGRELDAEIAVRLFGSRVFRGLGGDVFVLADRVPISDSPKVPNYSTSWDAMPLVVERLVALGYDVDTSVGPDCDAVCGLVHNGDRESVQAIGKTLPHAVALAALKAVEASRE